MHNGGIAGFNMIKRRLQADLPNDAFDMVQGNTGAFTPSHILFWRSTVILVVKTRNGRSRCSYQKYL